MVWSDMKLTIELQAYLMQYSPVGKATFDYEMPDGAKVWDVIKKLGVPDELSIIDIMLFGVPAKAPYKRWKKTLPQIMSFDRFDMKNFMTIEQIEEWVREHRHKVMYRDEAKVD